MVVAFFLAYTRLRAHEQGIIPSTPSLITFEAVDTLVRRFLPIGHLYRDTLLHNSGLMLPHPEIFEHAYNAAFEKQSTLAPRYGAGAPLDDWWRAVARQVYDDVLADYPDESKDVANKVFDRVFEDLYADELTGAGYWQRDPAAERILAGLREWRDERDGPRIGVISMCDKRVVDLLKNLFGEDVVQDTFDFIVTNSDEDLPFDIAAKVHGLSPDSCLHVHPYDDDFDVPYRSLQLAKSSDEFPYDEEGFPRDQLVDLIDIWELPEEEDDNILVVNRQFFPFDPDFDHGDPNAGPDPDDVDMQPPSYADPSQEPVIPEGGYPPLLEQREADDAAPPPSESEDES